MKNLIRSFVFLTFLPLSFIFSTDIPTDLVDLGKRNTLEGTDEQGQPDRKKIKIEDLDENNLFDELLHELLQGDDQAVSMDLSEGVGLSECNFSDEMKCPEVFHFASSSDSDKLAVSSDGKTLAVLKNGTITLNVQSGISWSEYQTIKARNAFYFKFSPDSTRLAIFQKDNHVLLYQKTNTQWIKFNEITFDKNKNLVDCKFSSTGKTLAVRYSAKEANRFYTMRYSAKEANRFYTIALITKLNSKNVSIQHLTHSYSIAYYRFSPAFCPLKLAAVTECGQLSVHFYKNKNWSLDTNFTAENIIKCEFSHCGNTLAATTLCGRLILYQRIDKNWVGVQSFEALHVLAFKFSATSLLCSVVSNSIDAPVLLTYYFNGQDWLMPKVYNFCEDTNRQLIISCQFSCDGNYCALLRKGENDDFFELNIFKSIDGDWIKIHEEEFWRGGLVTIEYVSSSQVIINSQRVMPENIPAKSKSLLMNTCHLV